MVSTWNPFLAEHLKCRFTQHENECSCLQQSQCVTCYILGILSHHLKRLNDLLIKADVQTMVVLKNNYNESGVNRSLKEGHVNKSGKVTFRSSIKVHDAENKTWWHTHTQLYEEISDTKSFVGRRCFGKPWGSNGQYHFLFHILFVVLWSRDTLR